jgi:hypothetical protein
MFNTLPPGSRAPAVLDRRARAITEQKHSSSCLPSFSFEFRDSCNRKTTDTRPPTLFLVPRYPQLGRLIA